MTREQAEQEYRKLLKERQDEADRIIAQAKAEGKWIGGLDSNRELFKGISEKYYKRIKELQASIDE